MSKKIKCAVVGVGNCFAGLVQGIEGKDVAEIGEYV